MKTLFFIGSVEDAVKLGPIIRELRKYDELFNSRIYVQARRQDMPDQVLEFFGIKPDFNIDVMKQNRNHVDIIASIMMGIKKIINAWRPDYLVVQGGKTTAFAATLAAFYERVRVIHIEAGLWASGKFPFSPEEMNGVFISKIADIHFASTARAKENLVRAAIPENKIHVVGNTAVDALFLCLEKVEKMGKEEFSYLKAINFDKRVILVTGPEWHNNEKPFENICRTLKAIAERDGVEVVYAYYLNSCGNENVIRKWNGRNNLHLINLFDYPSFVWLMNRAYIIITDSEFVQVVAPSIGKPVLVTGDVIDWEEGVEAGVTRIVGMDPEFIACEAFNLLDNQSEYDRMAKGVNPYGDGMACIRIRQVFAKNYSVVHNENSGYMKASRNLTKNSGK